MLANEANHDLFPFFFLWVLSVGIRIGEDGKGGTGGPLTQPIGIRRQAG